jgi:hypothetical protein
MEYETVGVWQHTGTIPLQIGIFPIEALPSTEAGAWPLLTTTNPVNVEGFEIEYPHFHSETWDRFSPDGVTWNGFRKDLTHKVTNTKVGPDGKTWAEHEKEIILRKFSKDHSDPDCPPSDFDHVKLATKLAWVERKQKETFVGNTDII